MRAQINFYPTGNCFQLNIQPETEDERKLLAAAATDRDSSVYFLNGSNLSSCYFVLSTSPKKPIAAPRKRKAKKK